MDQPERSSPFGDVGWTLLRSDTSAGGMGCVGGGVLVFGAFFAVAAMAAVVVRGFSVPILLFVVIGLGVAGAGVWQVLAAVGPRPRLWAERRQIEVGESLRVRWEVRGRFKEARAIQITWEGAEVSVERAYNPVVHRFTFATRVLTSEIGPLAGTTSLAVPETAMPSFTAKNARIEWLLRAEVATQMWPGVKESYAIAVLPSRRSRHDRPG